MAAIAVVAIVAAAVFIAALVAAGTAIIEAGMYMEDERI